MFLVQSLSDISLLTMKYLPLILTILLLFLTPQGIVASNPTSNEVKALLITKILNFIEWPNTSEDEKLVVCVLGNKEIFETLKIISLDDEDLIITNKIKNSNRIDMCKAVYIDKSTIKNQLINIKEFKNRPILTISDYQNFNNEGGIISFISSGKRINFRINNKIAMESGIKVSSKLLNLSKRVQR